MKFAKKDKGIGCILATDTSMFTSTILVNNQGLSEVALECVGKATETPPSQFHSTSLRPAPSQKDLGEECRLVTRRQIRLQSQIRVRHWGGL